jgi:hypothetical protein
MMFINHLAKGSNCMAKEGDSIPIITPIIMAMST